MIFKYEDRYAEVSDTRITLYQKDRRIYSCDFDTLINYSCDRPWKLEKRSWTLVRQEEEAQWLKLVFASQGILARLYFELADADLKLVLTFVNDGKEEMPDFTGALTLPVSAGSRHKVTIPHLIYNDNPSGDPERIIPHIGTEDGKGVIVEEHRLPIPAVNIEWQESDGATAFITLLSKPDVKTGSMQDYYSLGALKITGGEMITSLSGPLMFNGTKDVVYGGRCTPLSYQGGYRTLRSGDALRKEYYLGWGTTAEGRGFRSIVDMGGRILRPATTPMHSASEMIAYKQKVIDSRFYRDEKCVGYQTFGAANDFGSICGRPEYFLYGWTGQAIKLAWCECKQGLEKGDEEQIKRSMDVVDFFVRGGESAIPGLYYGYYMIEADSWRGAYNKPEAGLSSRIEGESMSDLADMMILLTSAGRQVPKAWEDTLRRACDFMMNEDFQTEGGFYPMEWTKEGKIGYADINTAGVPCVVALAKASEYFGEKRYLTYAADKCEVYYNIHMKTFERPFARATMDARCEDKEAGLYFFEAASELYRLTYEERFKEWAALAGDWILTFVFFWETGFQKGTPCAEKGFHTTGWPGVSVQNHHLDVFFPSYDMYAFGRRSGLTRFEQMGLNVNNALTYGVCTKKGEWGYSVIGEQGEQYYNTNYFQVRYPSILVHMDNWRGGMQRWNPSWITAQVMSNAIRFKEHID